MLPRCLSIVALVGAGWLFGSFSPAMFVQDAGEADRRAQEDQAAAASRPGDEHRWLAEDAGTWNAVSRDLVAGVSHDPPSEGTATVTMLPGGLWQITDYRKNDGSFGAHTITGWDPKKKKFISITVSSRSPTPWYSEGTLDPEKKVLNSDAALCAAGPLMNQHEIHIRKDRDHRRFEVRLPWRNESGVISNLPWEPGLAIEFTRR